MVLQSRNTSAIASAHITANSTSVIAFNASNREWHAPADAKLSCYGSEGKGKANPLVFLTRYEQRNNSMYGVVAKTCRAEHVGMSGFPRRQDLWYASLPLDGSRVHFIAPMAGLKVGLPAAASGDTGLGMGLDFDSGLKGQHGFAGVFVDSSAPPGKVRAGWLVLACAG